ncbi:MAG: LysR family transcriptional regulator [Deltaproteobacteria bacterium]|nr:LysR family transcriptional regulator [Deltaproteobacteria bacterium]
MLDVAALDPANLVALHVLLEERHVTRAAHRLGLTQSSMSHRLRRLREALGDPLLVPVGGALVPTPRGAAIAAPLASALAALQAAVAPPARFDPATSAPVVTVAMPDLLIPLVPALLADLTRAAPRAELRIVNVPADLSAALATGTPTLALAPTSFVHPGIVARALGHLRFGVAARRGHPALARLTVASWLAHPHVVVRVGNQTANLVGDELARRGLTRRVGVEVPTFLAGLLLVAGSDLLLNAPTALVHEVASALDLVVRATPIAIPRVPFAMLWHERFRVDAAHAWARGVVFAAIRRRLQRGLDGA